MDFTPRFDAVFSNAALHWMKDADTVIGRVAQALLPNGRFVAEMGGHGCVKTLLFALIEELDRRGHDGDAANPWYFPTAEDYRARLAAAGFDVAPYVRIAMGADLQACRDALKPELALYIGGMGARTKNFYNDFTKHLGYEEAAVKIQDAFLSGKRAEAIAAVPDTLVDEVSLVGGCSADRRQGHASIV